MSAKTKCGACDRKVSLIEKAIGTCKCSRVFCSLHRLPEQHECSYNFKDEKEKNMPKPIIAEKVKVI